MVDSGLKLEPREIEMNRKTLEIDERIQGEAAFISSPKIRRSPVRKPRVAGNSSGTTAGCTGTENAPKTPQLQNTQQTQAGPAVPLPNLSSPRQEFIYKMRHSEEETLSKCQSVVRRIKLAMVKQRNISMEVQNGVSELEELFDIMKSYRGNWKVAEKEKEANKIPVSIIEDKSGRDISTPVTSLNKRGASSPPEIRPEKKARERTSENVQTKGKESEEEWKLVKSKKTLIKEKEERRKVVRERPEALIIHPAEGRSYSDVLRNIRKNINPDESDISIRTVQKTKTGAILIEMGKGGRREEFRQNLESVLNQDAVVKDLIPMVTLEIRDLDSLTNTEEIVAAVEEEIGEKKPNITVRLTESNSWEQRRAFVSMPADCAYIILKLQRIKIGWTRCRITVRDELVRCFRCFVMGHRQWECKGPDRKSLCIKCGEEGHRRKECQNATKCCICSTINGVSTDHLAGSRRCEVNKKRKA